MTMTDVRAAALGEFPAPPPCPHWCETDHDKSDHKFTTSWHRVHKHGQMVTLPSEPEDFEQHVWVHLYRADDCFGGRWSAQSKTELAMGPLGGSVWADVSHECLVKGLLAVAGLIAPEVRDAVQAAALLASSPEVTPAGEDQ